jgi:hypothetical protein
MNDHGQNEDDLHDLHRVNPRSIRIFQDMAYQLVSQAVFGA